MKMIEAAKLYYQLDYSQQEIAKKIGVSRPTVSRMLQQAKEEGIVQIKIMDPQEDSEKIALALETEFGLKKAVVVYIPQYADNIVKKYIGEAASHYLYQNIQTGDQIAVSWGTTLYQVALSLQHKHVKDITVVQLNGGVSHSETNTYASEIIQLFGKSFHTNPYHLPLPAIVDHVVVKQAIEADRHIRRVLEIARQANIALFTVGVPTADSVLIQTNYFSDEELEIIRTDAVGDICSRYINDKGEICHKELNDRTIGIELRDLSKKDQSILVAGGQNKIDAIYGALQGGYANVFITDQYTARSLLDIRGDVRG